MPEPAPTTHLFLVERYDECGPPEPALAFPDLPAPLRLACAVRVPADEVVLAVIEASDEAAIRAAATAAGWRIDRIMPAAWATGAGPVR